MIPYTDDIINIVNKLLPQDESAWELVGFINKEKIYIPLAMIRRL